MDKSLDELIQDMTNHTDVWPWYWFSYGEKCYAFAVVEAFPLVDGAEFPEPGSMLEYHDYDDEINEPWTGDNGTRMMVNQEIASFEIQSGGTVCSYIAGAHAANFANHFDLT